MKRILVTGSYGQIGTELVGALRRKYGGDNVVATGRKKPPAILKKDGPYLQLDILDTNQLHAMLVDYDIDIVIHNASLLSGTGEKNPQLAYRTNIEGGYNVLEAVRILKDSVHGVLESIVKDYDLDDPTVKKKLIEILI